MLLQEDYTVMETVIRDAYSKSPTVLRKFADKLHVNLQGMHVASADNDKDAASWHVDRDHYKLAYKMCSCVLSRVQDPFHVDLFAITTNAQHTRFLSTTRFPGTAGVDSLLQSLRGMRCCTSPPFGADVILQVMQQLQLQAEVLFVVPDLPEQAWHQELIMLADAMHRLPACNSLFLSGVLSGCVPAASPPK